MFLPQELNGENVVRKLVLQWAPLILQLINKLQSGAISNDEL